ncbi:DNA/RNA non-specific endonuclease [Solibacillus sp. FSL K6-1523]|uniref:DNA/RNA non-specific endonuclease n=1 Tax=Solibacillus sp. FSL K6-1523 TaxID=2921471 RepID=UPI0030FCC5BA
MKSLDKGTGKAEVLTHIKVNYGDQFTKIGRKKSLKPNVEYKSPDGSGRITDCEGSLVLGTAERNAYAQRTVGGKDRLPDDDGGHLIGAQFKGPKDIDNLVPQNSQINRSVGEWFNMETEWANALKETPPKKVYVKIEPVYQGNSQRPSHFDLVYEIEGKEMVEKNIRNQSGG